MEYEEKNITEVKDGEKLWKLVVSYGIANSKNFKSIEKKDFQKLTEFKNSSRKGLVIRALDNKKQAGTIIGSIGPDRLGGENCEVDLIFVEESYRKKNVAATLMQKLFAWFKKETKGDLKIKGPVGEIQIMNKGYKKMGMYPFFFELQNLKEMKEFKDVVVEDKKNGLEFKETDGKHWKVILPYVKKLTTFLLGGVANFSDKFKEKKSNEFFQLCLKLKEEDIGIFYVMKGKTLVGFLHAFKMGSVGRICSVFIDENFKNKMLDVNLMKMCINWMVKKKIETCVTRLTMGIDPKIFNFFQYYGFLTRYIVYYME